jgi:hypothetical protein
MYCGDLDTLDFTRASLELSFAPTEIVVGFCNGTLTGGCTRSSNSAYLETGTSV